MFEKNKLAVQAHPPAAQLSPSLAVSISEDSGTALMLKVRAGDRTAFEMLYAHYRPKVEGYLFQLTRNREAAEELAQELFLKVYRHRESYEPQAKFSAWLWQMARNIAIDKLRKKKETPLSSLFSGESEENIDELLELPTSDLETLLLERSSLDKVEKIMATLPESQREALSLRALSDLSYEEISGLMKISVPSVKSLIFRARKTLVERMREDE